MKTGLALFDFPPHHAVRATDPGTSQIAAERGTAGRVIDRWRVLNVHRLHPHGLTDFELADKMDHQQTSVGKRRGELRDLGLIEQTDQRRPSPSGFPAIVWRITQAGMEFRP